MRKVSPLPGACVKVEADGSLVYENWQIEGEGPRDDPSNEARGIAILYWLMRRAMRIKRLAEG